MIILTYRRLATAAPLQVGQPPPAIFVEQFADEAEGSARAKAAQVTRDGAVDVYLSRVCEKYSIVKNVQVDEIR